MADTQGIISVTSSSWVEVATGPISLGTVSPERHDIRISISTSSSPSNLKQGHLLSGNKAWGFQLATGETLYAIAEGVNTTIIVTY